MRTYFFLFLFVSAVSFGAGTSYTWLGNDPSDNSWSTATNWRPTGVPGTDPSDVATIGYTTNSPKLDRDRTLADLVFSQQTLDLNGFTLTLTTPSSFISNGLITNGSLKMTDDTSIDPTMMIIANLITAVSVNVDAVTSTFGMVASGGISNPGNWSVGNGNGTVYLFTSLPASGGTSVNLAFRNPSLAGQVSTVQLTVNAANQITALTIIDEGDNVVLPTSCYTLYNNSTFVLFNSMLFSTLFTCDPTSANTNQNYVRTQTPWTAQSDTGLIDDLPAGSVMQHTAYYDGLGRILEEVTKQASPTKKDLVQLHDYNDQYNTLKEYLPYANDVCHGGYVDYATAVSHQQNFYTVNQDPSVPKVIDPALYTGTQTNSYVQRVYDGSALNRVVEEAAPGDPWKLATDQYGFYSAGTGKTIKQAYRSNAANEVLLWTYDYTTGNAAALSGGAAAYYAAGTLYMEEHKDEDDHKTVQFKDMDDRVVLHREVKDATTNLDTYYVYDDFGRLVYVIPPQATSQLGTQGWSFTPTSTFAQQWVFAYQYDARHRIVGKRAPGASAKKIVYDLLDRPVMVQDGNQAALSQWTFTKYDALGRPVYTGLYSNSAYTASSIQSIFNSATSFYEKRSSATSNLAGYSKAVFPSAIATSDLLTIDYYDNYDFDHNGTDNYKYRTANLGTSEPVPLMRVVGHVTGSKIKYGNSWLCHVPFYDKKARVVQTRWNNPLFLSQYPTHTDTLLDMTTTVYDFTGRKLKVQHLHTPAVIPTVMVLKTYTYDHMGRQLTLSQKNNADAAVLVSSHRYNELGQEIERNLHSEDNGKHFLQSVDYRRNIRGWLTGINNSALSNDGITNDDANDLFGMTFSYQDNVSGIASAPVYNGNISIQRWKTNNPSLPASAFEKAYSFTYDGVNRLASAAYAEKSTAAGWAASTGYGESVSYDLNGNISTLKRTNVNTVIDDLSFFYSGNQLTSVSDAGYAAVGFVDNADSTVEYDYDANGNMTGNDNSFQSLQYNYLNLPTRITQSEKTVGYAYDALGKKMQLDVSDSRGQPSDSYYYVDGFVYRQHYDATCTGNCYALLFIQNEAGRVKQTSAGLRYEYDLKDHLGNVHATFDKGPDGTASLIQEDHYYPFGMRMPGLSYDNGSGNLFLYNGKELQTDVNLYDYGARFYDPAVGRFTTVDPQVEKYDTWSPYLYGANNPIRFVDRNGEGPGYPTGNYSPEQVAADAKFGEGIIEGIKDQVAGLWGMVTNPIRTAVNLYNAVSHPVETGKAIANAAKETGSAIVRGDTKTAGKLASGVITSSLATNFGKIANVNKVEKISPNVQKVLDKINEIKKDGGSVKMNPLDVKNKQELNMTVKASDGSKLDMRIETHEIPKNLGGNGTIPQRHMNVDVFNSNGNKMKLNNLNKGHKLLE